MSSRLCLHNTIAGSMCEQVHTARSVPEHVLDNVQVNNT